MVVGKSPPMVLKEKKRKARKEALKKIMDKREAQGKKYAEFAGMTKKQRLQSELKKKAKARKRAEDRRLMKKAGSKAGKWVTD